MRAIVIEGAKGASEYQLWDQMVQEKCPGLQHYLGLRWGVCPASGNGGILTCLDLLLRLAKHDYTYDGLDTDILVCYDTTVNSKIKEDFLSAYGQWYNDRFKNTNTTDKELSCVGLQGTIRIHLVRYYCFEDCLLLSTILLDWVYSKERQQDVDKLLLASLDEYKKIHSKFLRNRETERHVFEKHKDSYVNLEKWYSSRGYGDITKCTMEMIASKLLSDITERTYFHVNKKSLASCWTCDCLANCDLDEVYQAWLGRNDPNIKRRFEERECGLFFCKLNTQKKIDELMKSSVMLREVATNNTWLFEQRPERRYSKDYNQNCL